MLARIIRWSLLRPRLIAAAALALLIVGLIWVQGLPLEIFPALVPARTLVQTEAPGLAAEQVEQLVTRPVENALGAVPGTTAIRSQSVQGLSVVTLEAARGASAPAVRQLVAERLAQAVLPQGLAAPKIAPLTAPTGDILKIGFTSDRLDPMALREVVQWTVRPRLLAAAGVANVALYGGQVRRVEVRARPGDLSDSDLGFNDVLQAIRRATSVAGAGFMDTPQQRVTVDLRGQALTAEDVASGQIQTPGNAPVRIGDVSDVVDAPAPATGDALIMGKPGVLAEVSGVYGGNTRAATRAVEQALDVLRPALAARGVTVTDDLDRPADFISGSLRALLVDLAIGLALMAVALLLALRDLRAVALCLLAIPLPLLASLIALKLLGLTLNAMTLGGLFVALGVVINDVVIDAESVLSRLRDAQAHHHEMTPVDAVQAALTEVRAPVIYATLLIDIALLPMLAARGVFGALAAPLALSAIVASLASMVVAATLTPALAMLLLQTVRPRPRTPLLRRMEAVYAGWVARSCRRPRLALLALALAAAAASAMLYLMPRGPIPSFHDRHLIVEARAPVATSPEAMRRIATGLTRAALATPGVQQAAERAGRDPTGFGAGAPDRAQIELRLAPLDAAGQDRVAERLRQTFAGYPDVDVTVRPRLNLNPEEAPDALTVGVYGENLDAVDRAAADVAAALKAMGGAGVGVDAGPPGPVIRVDLNFKRLALYGLAAADVLDTMQAVLEGKTVAQVYDNGRAIDLALTGPENLRRDPEAIGGLLLRSSSGVSVPLKLVANVYLTEGRARIDHEAGQRQATVTAAPAGGDPAAFAEAARSYMRDHIKLPPGVYLTYGAPGAEAAADSRNLLTGGAIAALAMVGLLMLAIGDGRLAALILLSTAFSFIGGALAAILDGGLLTLGSLAGFVALFGLSIRGAILMVTRPHELHIREDAGWTLHILAAAAARRAPPILLTAVLVALGLLPLLFTGSLAGSEILRPMAVVILGGLLSGAALTLLLLPALVYAYSRPVRPGGAATEA